MEKKVTIMKLPSQSSVLTLKISDDGPVPGPGRGRGRRRRARGRGSGPSASPPSTAPHPAAGAEMMIKETPLRNEEDDSGGDELIQLSLIGQTYLIICKTVSLVNKL